MRKKLLTLMIISTMIFATLLNPSIANQSNHGQYVSNVAKSTEPGPDHGQIVSEAARSKSQNDYALSFDGIDDYMVMPHTQKYDFANITKEFSVEFWFKTPGNQYEPDAIAMYLFTKHTNQSSPGILTGVGRTGGRAFVYGGSTGSLLLTQNSYQDNQWHHFTLSVNANIGITFLRVDNEIVYGVINNIEADYSSIIVGKGAQTNKEWFKGSVDEIRLWNKALTQEEIQANMYREIQPQDGLVGYWQFEEGSEDIAHDSSGNENDGTLVNGPTWTTDTPF